MKRNSIWIAFVLAAGVCGTLLRSAPAETPEQRGKRVVYEALQALGGDAFLHMDGRIEAGRAYSFYNKQISGLSIAKIYTRYLTPVPGKLEQRERENFGLKEDSSVLLTETEGWQINYHGAIPMDAEQYTNYQISTLRNIFYILRQRLQEPELSFYSQGIDMVDNRPAEIVDITDADTNTVTVYFDSSTKLPVKQKFRRRNEQYHDFDTEVSLYGLYRNVGGGVQWPCNISRERNGEKIYEMISEQVLINQDLQDNLFSLAIDQKMMKRK